MSSVAMANSSGAATEVPVSEGSEPVLSHDEPGLGARLESVLAVAASVVAELDPARLSGADATTLYSSLVGLERLCTAGKTLLAPRIDTSGIWRDQGHRDAAVMLASLEGIPTGQARTTLSNGERLAQLPGTEAALRSGALSTPKVTELAGAGILSPEREAELLDGAATEPLFSLRKRCERSKATAAGSDPMATTRRIRKDRFFSSWTDSEGAFCYRGRDTADRGAQILTHLGSVATALRKTRRPTGTEHDDPERAVRADAVYALITRRHPDSGASLVRGSPSPDRSTPGSGGGGVGGGPTPAVGTDTGAGSDPGPGSDVDPGDGPADDSVADDPAEDSDPRADSALQPADPRSIIDRPPTCTVMVRVDLDALFRGYAEEGEYCEIDGQGPIPVPMARDMANDSFLRLMFHRAGRIQAITHLHRTINKKLRTALQFRDTICVVPGCEVSYGLEVDHVIPFSDQGPTELDNLALLCHHHHLLKTNDSWILTRVGDEEDGSPIWTFERPPAFGQEPGLGLDTPEGREQWRQQTE
jgi:hypothetical protein